MWNKIIIMLSTAVLITTSTAYAFEFEDTKNHWGKEYIETLSEHKVVSGMEDGMFHPNEAVTTEQFVTMVIRCGRGDIAPIDNTWSSGYLHYALSQGIIEDYDVENRQTPIERRAAARIVHEMLLIEYDEKDETDWLDAQKLRDLYDCHTCVNHIAQMYAKGVMTGREETLFDNYGTLTRAEAAAIIVRMTDKNKRILPQKAEKITVQMLTPDEAFAMTDVLIADVRTQEEYDIGHIRESVNIPLDEIEKNPYAVSENKNKTIILYCVKGYKSSIAAQILIEAGYTSVCTLPGVEQYEYELIK